MRKAAFVILAFAILFGFSVRSRLTGEIPGRDSRKTSVLASTFIYDLFDMGSWGDPVRGLRQKYREDTRTSVNLMVEHLEQNRDQHPLVDPLASNGTSPADVYSDNQRSAELGYQFRLAERRLNAELDGLRLKAVPDAAVFANTMNWQTVNCLNVNTDQMEPCQFVEGDVLEAWDTITSDPVRKSNGQLWPIDPRGLAKDDPNSEPLDPRYPRFALIGRMKLLNGSYSDTVLVGQRFVIPHAIERLELRVNGDYRDRNDWPHSTWFSSENSGSFKYRLSESPYNKPTEENPPAPKGRLARNQSPVSH